MKKRNVFCILLLTALLLSGCMKTVDELYCLPKRSQAVNDLQPVIDEAMRGLEYSAPQSGDNRQVVQTADLDGDGMDEYLLFAKDSSEKPLKILIFCQLASGYVLMDTIEGFGFSFDFVTYRQVDGRPGVEIVVGRLVSEEVVRSVSVYRFSSGIARHLLTTGYSRMLAADADGDGLSELYLLNQSATENGTGNLSVYTYRDEQLHRVSEMPLSCAADDYKQIICGVLQDGTKAIYVTCASGGTLITDVFATIDGKIAAVATQIQTGMLNDYYVFPEDLDRDGVLEIPRLQPIMSAEDQEQAVVVWYSLDAQGQETVKMHTYHNYQYNWYLKISQEHLGIIHAQRSGSSCVFSFYDAETQMLEPVCTIMTLVDADRGDLAIQPGRVVLFSTETTIYVAELTDAAAKYGITSANLPDRFSTIRMDLTNEEE